MATILLARHGETDWNREHRFQGHADPPLNETGRAQARELAERLSGEGVRHIYASPLARARETAEIVGERLGVPVAVVPALMEVDVGSWSGLTRSEVQERFPEGYRRWLALGHGWDDGESYEELAQRAVPALAELGARHRGERILVVTHGGPIRAAHAAAAGIAYADERRAGTTLANCGYWAFACRDGGLRRLE